MHKLPTEGGSYLRDPKTGELTRQPDSGAQITENQTDQTVPELQGTPKKGGK